MSAPFRTSVSRLALLASAALAVASSAHAQTTAQDTTVDAVLVTGRTEGYQVKGTNTATKLPLTLRETPQSLTVFTRQRIEDFNLITVAEVFAQTPGVNVQQYDSNRILFNARGFAITNFQFDGVPTQYTTGAGGNSVLSDTSIYERIEVVRGATGLVTGAGDPSATINMVRKRPTEDFRASTSLSAGSWNYRRGEFDVSGPLALNGKVRGRLVGAYTDRESFIRFQHDRSPSLYGVVEVDLTDATRLRIGADYLRTDSQGGAWSASPLFFRDGTRAEFPRSYSAGAKWNRWERDSYNLFGVLEHDFGSGWVGRVAYNNRSTNTESLLMAGSNSTGFADRTTGLGLSISDTYTVSETREQSLDAYASGPFEAFGRQHELVVGGNYFTRDLRTINAGITSRPYSAFPSIYDWNGEIGLPGVSNTGKPSRIATTSEAGLYAALRLNPTDRLKIIAGGRFSDWDTKTDNFNTTTAAYTTTTGRYGEARISPYLGVLYDLTSNLTAFVSYADVFQPQTQRDKNFEQIAPKVGGNWEGGLKAEFFDKRLYASLNGFYMQQDNVAELDPTVPAKSLPDGSDAYRTVSGVETKGGEFEVSGAITPAWSITGGYTYTRSEDAKGQRVFTVNPLHMLKLNSTYKLGRWTLGGGVTWQTEVFQTMNAPTGRFNGSAPVLAATRVSQSGYVLADALVRYAFTDKISVGVNATNLFDKHYYRNVGYFNGGYWGEPRRVLFNLRARY
ncbi:TonB-dependent siderophore receptor [Caulobacter sp. RHG1]|uniref:TonB-dependent siderophore receptor n=1 Tax=Caulobacter sp. (strain RHG1) TaxID=2545762 RepID=UPI00155680C8|nr:TonB-dependent siderophore receptor [Caulobacter sp. RHG1]NQE62662.1 TonB-dependent siderophore receptor [Caulobacter sp. RHG1]